VADAAVEEVEAQTVAPTAEPEVEASRVETADQEMVAGQPEEPSKTPEEMEVSERAEQAPAVEQIPGANTAETEAAPSGQEATEEREELVVGEVGERPEVQAVQIPMAAIAQPNKPKKPFTSYWLFSSSMRDEIMKEHEAENGAKTKFGELARLLSARWSALPEEDRKVWDAKAAVDRQRYEAEMQTYLEGHDPAGALKAKCQHLIPKRPLSCFGLFCQDPTHRGRAAGLLKEEGKEPNNNKHLLAKLGELWRLASVEERAPFQEQQLTAHLGFLEKQKAWQATPEYTELERVSKEQEELRKVLEAAKAAEEAARLEREAKEKRTAARNARLAKTQSQAKNSTPAKRARGGSAASPPEAKKPRGARVEAAVVHLDPKVLMEATKLGFESGLRNLAERPEVIASGKSANAILASLRASGGLVNPAKRALLGR